MEHLINELILTAGGLISGILAGLLGSGGGVLCVPLLIALNYPPVQALGTSCLAVSIIAISGSIQNSRMGYFSLKRVLYIGLPALITTPIAAYTVSQIQPYWILTICGILTLAMIYLVELRKRLIARAKRVEALKQSLAEQPIAVTDPITYVAAPAVAYANKPIAVVAEKLAAPTQQGLPNWLTPLTAKTIATGGVAGLFAGALGGGSGSLLVPLQMLVLGESIKVAIQTSVGVNIITSTVAWISHASRGDVLLIQGFLLGLGGFVGAQIGTRCLPKLPDRVVTIAFNSLLVILSAYMLWKAWVSYQGL